MDYKIEEATIDDAEEILALQKLAYRIEADRYKVYDIPPLTQTISDLMEQFKDHKILKAVKEGAIIGTVRAREEDNTCYIGRLAVLPDFQRKGIGSALMKEIEQYFKPERYELFTGYESRDTISIYERLGYSVFKTGTEKCGAIKLVYMQKKYLASLKG